MSSARLFGEKSSLLSSNLLTLIGLSLSIAAVLLPSWQVVNLREYNSIHEHGLWLDCTRHSRDGNANVLLRRYATYSEPLHCVYKFDYDKYSGTFDIGDDNSPVGEVNRHKFYGWHTSTLILLGLAILSSFLTICVGVCACCHTSVAFIYSALILLTTFLSVVAEGIFFFFSHRADNRFIKGIVGTYEQRVGLAFFLQMAACACHFCAFLISLIFVYFTFNSKGNFNDNYSINRSSKLTNTSMGRSMDFEPQITYQHHQPSTNIRPPYYTKQESYQPNAIGSMPELGLRHSSIDELSQRVRTKSETCV